MVCLQPPPYVTVTVCPATVSVPVRDGPVVAAASYTTAPLPLPSRPDRMSIQSTWEVAVHTHRALEARTSTVFEPPESGNDVCDEPSSNLHSPAACVISTRLSLATMAPLR